MRTVLVLLGILITAPMFAQEKVNITVKATEANNGVVIVTAQKVPIVAGQQMTEPAKKTIELQCNKEASSCAVLKPGSYLMVKLPPNRGMYECVNAQVFAANADPATADRIGEYCLTEK